MIYYIVALLAGVKSMCTNIEGNYMMQCVRSDVLGRGILLRDAVLHLRGGGAHLTECPPGKAGVINH